MCYKTFTSIIKLNDHTETRSWNKKSKRFTSITKLNKHTKTVHGTEKLMLHVSQNIHINKGIKQS